MAIHEGPPYAAIEVTGLRKTYPGGIEAVRGIDFAVAPGEVFGLLGPNGAGKSTTVGMLTTTVAPTAGSARVAGHDVAREPLAARRAASVVFQESVLDRALSGRRNLEHHARLWGVDAAATRGRIAELAERLDLGELLERPAGTLSGGERRRLEIARALLSAPRVLFLDEPSVGLDPRVRAELVDAIAGLRERSGLTTLLTTHYLEEAELLCDRVAIVHDGRIVALDAPRALRAALGDEVVELRVRDHAAAAVALLRGRGLADDDAFSVGTTITLPARGRAAAEIVAAIDGLPLAVAALGIRPTTLDDVYLRLTGGRLDAAA
jgi:ABC-2 type transport system ATP-binding protein